VKLKNFIEGYDFENFGSPISYEQDYTSATSLLKLFTDLNSLQINCVVSATSINLTQA